MQVSSLFILGTDTLPFVRWWLASICFGIGFYPLGAILFSKFQDKGWIFSKILGIGLGGYLTFLWASTPLFRFRFGSCLQITLYAAILTWILFLKYGTEEQKKRPALGVILRGELLFLLLFFFWTWCSGFHPAADSTEKPMDYGFMAAMIRSDSIPATDMWYSDGGLNYYYGGQFYAVYLTKLTCTRVKETYHLMRALVAAFCFTAPWSILRQALKDRGLSRPAVEIGGIFAGALVSLAGNVHYLLYGLFGSVFKLTGWDDYWFPSSTRFIGHNPLTDDQCIHEFPSYSFVLGDLHAHVVNLFLVVAFIGIMYAWFQTELLDKCSQTIGSEASFETEKNVNLLSCMAALFRPHIFAAGILIGIFKWTNFWDFIIYLTVFLFTAACIFFRKRQIGNKRWILQILASMLLVYILQTVIAYPFTSEFDTMFKGVGLSIFHTASYQLLILWGLPIMTSILLALVTVRKNMNPVDLFFVMLSICGIGLVMIPELVYVKDIYEGGFARSNTMFKLTYQAYVMFGMVMAYAFFRILLKSEAEKRVGTLFIKGITGICGVIACLTLGYGGYAVNCWFGNILDPEGYEGLNATAYLEDAYPEDAAAIRSLDASLKGQPVVLEAPGDSYSTYCRVSAMTGLPTVEGWYVHEWLWRDDPEDLNLRKEDVRQIYTNDDPYYVEMLLQDYDVSYIFIGSCEREEYGDDLNEQLLRSLGSVCFDGQAMGIPNGAVVIDVRKGEENK